MKRTFLGTILPLLTAFGAVSVTAAADLKPEQRALFEIYKELVEINTTDSVGDNTQAARAMAARLVAAGFPQADVQVLVPPGNAKKGNVVARLRGNGTQKPVLLVAHLDVVEAHKEDWSSDLDPFKLIERDGYYYGRGTADDKATDWSVGGAGAGAGVGLGVDVAEGPVGEGDVLLPQAVMQIPRPITKKISRMSLLRQSAQRLTDQCLKLTRLTRVPLVSESNSRGR